MWGAASCYSKRSMMDDVQTQSPQSSDDIYDQSSADVVSYEVFYDELSPYGSWVDYPEYGYVWIPRVTGDFHPYATQGHWVMTNYGWTWVSDEPWGWAPYHFGRWSWYSGYGWLWIPGRVFSGAWVSWYYSPSYVGWCPLDFWDDPCYIGGFRGFDHHCWNFVSYPNVYVRHVTKVYVNPTIVHPDVIHGRGIVVRHPVRVGPRDLANVREAPGLVMKRARQFGKDSVIDTTTPRNGVTRTPFRDRERVTITRPGIDPNGRGPRGGGPDARPVRPNTERNSGPGARTPNGRNPRVVSPDAPKTHPSRNPDVRQGSGRDRREPDMRPP